MREALRNVIVSIEAREDGSFWLLVGEGPLGTDDLALITPPDNDGGGGGRGRRTNTPPGQPVGPTRGSRICMVGASRHHPYQRPVLWKVRLAV